MLYMGIRSTSHRVYPEGRPWLWTPAGETVDTAFGCLGGRERDISVSFFSCPFPFSFPSRFPYVPFLSFYPCPSELARAMDLKGCQR